VTYHNVTYEGNVGAGDTHVTYHNVTYEGNVGAGDVCLHISPPVSGPVDWQRDAQA